jgi:hypothetical protein
VDASSILRYLSTAMPPNRTKTTTKGNRVDPSRGRSLPSCSKKATSSLTSVTDAVDAAIDALPLEIIKEILQSSARVHPDVAARLRHAHAYLEYDESRKVINFDHYSKTLWRAINSSYHLKGSYQVEAAGGIIRQVQDCINKIDKGAGDMASFGTKKSAVETLRKIGKSVCLTREVIGKEVRQEYQSGRGVDGVMLRILGGMTAEERASIGTEFVDKCGELWAEAQGYCIFGKMPQVIAMLVGNED